MKASYASKRSAFTLVYNDENGPNITSGRITVIGTSLVVANGARYLKLDCEVPGLKKERNFSSSILRSPSSHSHTT